jgi:hypothetical protein
MNGIRPYKKRFIYKSFTYVAFVGISKGRAGIMDMTYLLQNKQGLGDLTTLVMGDNAKILGMSVMRGRFRFRGASFPRISDPAPALTGRQSSPCMRISKMK